MLATAQTQLHAQGTAFTYQGRLNFNAIPAAGNFDFRFKLYADPLGNTQVGGSYLTNAVPTTNGLFVTTIDFGAGIFTGGTNWLEIDVRTNGAASYTVLSPLQCVTPTPNAIFATTAGNVIGTVSAAQISGTVGNSVLPASPSFSGTVTANQISGNGANVTNVNAVLLNGKAATDFWQTGGNAGTSPANGNFLGTTDNQPLLVKVNGQLVMRYEPTTNTPNVVGGFSGNYIQPGIFGATIGGGGTVNFGQSNSIVGGGSYGTIAGGLGNTVMAVDAAIDGGTGNSISTGSSYSFVGGGSYNTIQTNAFGSVIGGGAYNQVGNIISQTSYFGPGGGNTIAGGINNLTGNGSTSGFIGGGGNNIIRNNAQFATIGGGSGNTASSISATIGGGNGNIASNSTTTVSGGYQNNASGPSATIPGGNNNVASGTLSFAAGNEAQALHQGAFVWADSQSATFISTANDQFLIRAQGGVGINTNNPAGAALNVNGKITAPMWKATNVINTAGPLTLSQTFTTSGGTLIISASGSGYSLLVNTSTGMDIKLDGGLVDSCLIYANGTTTHLAFVPKTIVKGGVAAGTHTLTLTARSGTTTDGSDNFCVTVQELPF